MPVKCQRDLTQFLGVIMLLKGAMKKKTFKVKIKKNVVKYFRERITPKVKCRMY